MDMPNIIKVSLEESSLLSSKMSLDEDFISALGLTYRVTGTDLTNNERFERVGVERYTFDNGRIAEKDVYSRPV